jgi:hypothetical protein
MQAPPNVEVWRNAANGPRWYIVYDVHGRESSKVVGSGRTFSLTVFERQVNQEKAATPDLDLFRNGGFILEKAAEDTVETEFASPNARTDAELEELALDLMGGHQEIDKVLRDLTSATTLNRLMEQLVAEGADSSLVEKVREAYHKVDTSKQARRGPRQVVVTEPEEEPALS